MSPASATKCIKVTFVGTLPSDVQLYSTAGGTGSPHT